MDDMYSADDSTIDHPIVEKVGIISFRTNYLKWIHKLAFGNFNDAKWFLDITVTPFTLLITILLGQLDDTIFCCLQKAHVDTSLFSCTMKIN